ncbi:hypothetical protein [Corynebacterium kalidii]|uniref:Uncharacterized protein n=1 Tax=Corynebacterium kalidii TaxID=2931982 RepID=A0A9X2B206_9CORY|nr:hypothetical protein [Corynebacterium kalidii]MCJ7858210.1 hypothetical protein [Corynebacterium kalidii]
MSPTKGQIYFAEYDVMKSVAASLGVAYSNRRRAASTEAERLWWESRRTALREFVAAAVDTDREDLVGRTRLMRDEFDRIGGLGSPGRD